MREQLIQGINSLLYELEESKIKDIYEHIKNMAKSFKRNKARNLKRGSTFRRVKNILF